MDRLLDAVSQIKIYNKCYHCDYYDKDNLCMAEVVDCDEVIANQIRNEIIKECDNCMYEKGRTDVINAIKNDLHDRLTEEMNSPYQNQNLCEGLYYAIQRCDWFLSDDKEQK